MECNNCGNLTKFIHKFDNVYCDVCGRIVQLNYSNPLASRSLEEVEFERKFLSEKTMYSSVHMKTTPIYSFKINCKIGEVSYISSSRPFDDEEEL